MDILFKDADAAVITGSLEMLQNDHTVKDLLLHESVDLRFERVKFGRPAVLWPGRNVICHISECGIFRDPEFLTDGIGGLTLGSFLFDHANCPIL